MSETIQQAQEKQREFAETLHDNPDAFRAEKEEPIEHHDPRAADPRMLRKYVVLHGGVGPFHRGRVITPLDLYGDTLFFDRARYRNLMRKNPGMPENVRKARSYRFLIEEEIAAQFDRLMTLNAVREATSFEATQTKVTLPEQQSTALATEEQIQRMKAEIERLRAENAKFNDLGHLAEMREQQAQRIIQTPQNDLTLANRELIAAKDAQIADLQLALASIHGKPSAADLGLSQPSATGELPPEPSPPGTDDGPITPVMPPSVEATKLHRPGSRSAERKGRNIVE